MKKHELNRWLEAVKALGIDVQDRWHTIKDPKTGRNLPEREIILTNTLKLTAVIVRIRRGNVLVPEVV